MSGKEKSQNVEERLDKLGREILRAASATEEAEAASASPFLYARLRSRIEAERGRRLERESWLVTLKLIWRAVPAMALVAVFAIALFLAVSFKSGSQASAGYDEPLLEARAGADVEGIVFDGRSLSSDEVLETILEDEEQEAAR